MDPSNGAAVRVMVALNADVVGYSRLLADDFDTTTSTLEQYRSLVSEVVAGEEGILINFVGDNFMAVFEEATAAMSAAISLTSQIETRNAEVPVSRRVRFRMGLDSGEVTESDGQWFGDTLNIAARIQSIAQPGGISVSGRVYRALDEPALRFTAVGAQALKNIPELVEVYQFADLPSDTAPSLLSRELSLEEPSVAVLPYHTGDLSPETSAAAAIARSDLIHRLTQVPQLQVVDAGHDAAASARYMIESGIHQAGGQVRVYARILDVSRMTGIKSLRWSMEAHELLSMSDQMAEEIAHSIEVDLIVGAPAALYAEIDDPEAVQQIYLGWYHLSSGSREGWAEAVDLFGRVAKTHPEQPYGYVLSAFANWVGADLKWTPDPEETFALAMEQARMGLRQGDPTGMAHAVEAAILMSQGKGDDALTVMEDVRITRPTCDVTFGLEGSVRRYLGQWEKSVVSLDKAMELIGMTKPWYPTVKACALYHGGRVEEAAATAEAVLEFQPNNLEALLVLAASQQELGLERRARATSELVRQRFPDVDVDEWIDSNPYQVEEMVKRWKEDLASVGLVEA